MIWDEEVMVFFSEIYYSSREDLHWRIGFPLERLWRFVQYTWMPIYITWVETNALSVYLEPPLSSSI